MAILKNFIEEAGIPQFSVLHYGPDAMRFDDYTGHEWVYSIFENGKYRIFYDTSGDPLRKLSLTEGLTKGWQVYQENGRHLPCMFYINCMLGGEDGEPFEISSENELLMLLLKLS